MALYLTDANGTPIKYSGLGVPDSTVVAGSTNAVSGGAVYNEISQLSNENLLINGDFRINQRGQTTYSTRGKYTLDRWLYWFSGSVTVGTQYITLSNTGNFDDVIQQLVENVPQYANATMTLSFYISTDASVWEKVVLTGVPSNDPSHWFTNYYCGFGFLSNTNNIYVNIGVRQGKTVYIKFAKFEVGDRATRFNPRPYPQELLMCQRYFCRYTANSTYHQFSVGYIKNTTTAYTFLPFKVTMRAKPTMVTSGSFVGNYYQGNVSNTSITIDHSSTDSANLYLGFTALGSQYVGGGIVLRANNDSSAYIDLEAEIF